MTAFRIFSVGAISLALLTGTSTAQVGKERISVTDGLRHLGTLCLATLPDFESAGSEWIAEGAVERARDTVWLHRMFDLSFVAGQHPEGHRFCSVAFFSDQPAQQGRAIVDSVFGGGDPDPADGSVLNVTTFAGQRALIITTVTSEPDGGSYYRLQVHSVPTEPK